MKILGISGALRRASFNTALLRAAAELLPEGASLEILDYADVPLFNEENGTPEPVERLRAAIRGADAVLFATPEYNHSIPGVLKNAIDWASRPPGKSAMAGGLPAAVLSASPGAIGGARAQQHLKPILAAMGVSVFNGPEFVLGHAEERFTDGQLTDARTREFLAKFLAGFVGYAARNPRV